MKMVVILIKILNTLILFGLTAAPAPPPSEAGDKKTWTYELISVTTTTSNPEILNMSFTIERVSRGVFAFSGEYTVSVDVYEDDNVEIELTAYRSANGDGDYKSIPMEMSRRPFFDCLNTLYKSVLMDTLKDCSNLPVFEDKAPMPIKAQKYYLDKCKFSQEGFPNHLESGTYKLLITGYGDIEFEIELIGIVEPDDF